MLTAEEKEAIRRIEELEGADPDSYCFRFMIILVETGVMQPWEVIYNDNYLYRI
jgi:hypothetical protein